MNRPARDPMNTPNANGNYGKAVGNGTHGTRLRNSDSATGETIFIYISIVSTLIFIAEMFTIVILKRCKKTPVTIKYLSINFLASDALFQITVSLFSIIKMTNIITDVLVMKISYQFTTGLTLAVSWASVNLLAFDRLIAVTLPIRYKLFVTKCRVVLVIICAWCLNILACSTSFIWFLIDCSGIRDICHSKNELRVSFTNKQHFTHLVLFVLNEIISAVAYVSLAVALRRYFDRRRKITTFGEKVKSNINQISTSVHRLILTLIFLQLVLHLPFLINLSITLLAKVVWYKTWREYVEVLSQCFIRISTLGSIYLYTWKLKECKYIFLSIFCRSNIKYGDTIRALWRELYKIPLPKISSQQISPSVMTSSNSFQFSPTVKTDKSFNFYN